MSDILVSIILVNYNTSKLTSDCIRTIYDQVKTITYEIIVVDNASKDSSVKDISQNFPDVKIISLPHNLGFGRANNVGANNAKGKYLFLLNTDTLLLNDPFQYFLEVMNKQPNVAVVGAYLKDKSGNIIESGGENYSIRQRLKYALYRLINKPLPPKCDYTKDIDNVDFVIGADMFIPKKIFEDFGGFDSRIFMYFEEAELCKRLKKSGYDLYLTKGPEIIHLVKGSSGTGSMFSKIHSTASIMYCIRKETKALPFLCFQILYFMLRIFVLFDYRYTLKNNFEYLMAIFRYKKYLAQ